VVLVFQGSLGCSGLARGRFHQKCGRTRIRDRSQHGLSGKLSYLVYPDFETDPHSALMRSVKLSLRTREIDCLDYATSTNPPVLHRKETFLASDHPLHAKFARLTQQEEKHGLLDDSSAIGTRESWSRRLAERGFALKGHRLVKVNAQATAKSSSTSGP
jgi:DNA phosphorothioation-associated putative methyltransferase